MVGGMWMWCGWWDVDVVWLVGCGCGVVGGMWMWCGWWDVDVVWLVGCGCGVVGGMWMCGCVVD